MLTNAKMLKNAIQKVTMQTAIITEEQLQSVTNTKCNKVYKSRVQTMRLENSEKKHKLEY